MTLSLKRIQHVFVKYILIEPPAS